MKEAPDDWLHHGWDQVFPIRPIRYTDGSRGTVFGLELFAIAVPCAPDSATTNQSTRERKPLIMAPNASGLL